jgi:hypothetical protein
MTENNAAPAAEQQARLSDGQLMAIATAAWEVHSRESYSPDGLLMACVAVQAAVLSKLRAEGVQAGDERFRSDVRELCEYAEGSMSVHIDTVHRVRAALASAPVAGEALGFVAAAALETNFNDPDARIDMFKTDLGLLGYYHAATPVAVYAAPQASEAVRNEALYLLREARALLPTFTTAEAIGNWSEKVNRFAAGDVIDIPPQAEKDGGDYAKGAGKWPMLSELHLYALMFAYNEGYSKAYDGRVFPNPFSENGSQAAAWQLGTDDGTEARAAQHPRTDGGGRE